MNNEYQPPHNSITCADCELQLADYVYAELDNRDVESQWPELFHHIETCGSCTSAYLLAFRQQGRQRPLSELQALGERHRSAPALDKILTTPPAVGSLDVCTPNVAGASNSQPVDVEPVVASPTAPPAPESNWRESLIEQGKIWLDQSSGQVRQIAVGLADLLNPVQPNAALGGLMSGSKDEHPSDDDNSLLSGTILLPPEAGIEVKVMAEAITKGESINKTLDGTDSSSDGQSLCQLQVAVTLVDQLGDYSGVDVLLRWGESAYNAQTDTMGIARFDALAMSEIPSMSLTISV